MEEKTTDFLDKKYSLAQSIFKICFKNQANQMMAKCGLYKARSLEV